jgi:hypothetical protein
MKRAAQFGVGMIGWGDAIEANAVINGRLHSLFVHFFFLTVIIDFPWGKLREGTTVCDFGGGVGNISTQLANSYPGLRLVLQDLPHQLKIAEEEVWPEHCPKAIAEHRIEFIPFDFLQEPPKQGCDIFYVSCLNSFCSKSSFSSHEFS